MKALGLVAAPSPRVEYGNLTLTLELVDSLSEAVDHIHANGSGHTEAIITGGAPVCSLLLLWTHALLLFEPF